MDQHQQLAYNSLQFNSQKPRQRPNRNVMQKALGLNSPTNWNKSPHNYYGNIPQQSAPRSRQSSSSSNYQNRLYTLQQNPNNNSSRNSAHSYKRNPSEYNMKTQQQQNEQSSGSNSFRLQRGHLDNRLEARDIINQRRSAQKQQIQKARQEQMVKRVKQLQEKVLPLIEGGHHQNTIKDENEFGWENRLQQKILKLEIHVDEIKKNLELAMQKRLIEIQKRFQDRLEELQNIYMMQPMRESNINGGEGIDDQERDRDGTIDRNDDRCRNFTNTNSNSNKIDRKGQHPHQEQQENMYNSNTR